MCEKNKTKEQRNKVTAIVEFILLAISLLAFGGLMLSLGSMIEAMTISKTPLTISIICGAWLGIFSLYAYLVNR